MKVIRPRSYSVWMRRLVANGTAEDRAWTVYAYSADEARKQLERTLELEMYRTTPMPEPLYRWSWVNTFATGGAQPARSIERVTKRIVECDCSAATPCPQGRVGSQRRCQVWTSEPEAGPKGDRTVNIPPCVDQASRAERPTIGHDFEQMVDNRRALLGFLYPYVRVCCRCGVLEVVLDTGVAVYFMPWAGEKGTDS